MTPWTPERTKRLKALALEGATGPEIAAELEITRNAVIGKIHRLKLTWAGASARQHRNCGPRRKLRPRQQPKVAAAWVIPFKPRKVARQTKGTGSSPRAASVSPLRRKHRRPCTLKTLKADSCRFPLWNADTASKGFRYCNSKAVNGRPYCCEHCAIAYK